jgi:hypothetical protein
MEKYLKVALSGTIATGKTTITKALTQLTGIPMVNTRSVKEIISDNLPGKTLESCTHYELFQLCIYKFIDNIRSENKMAQSFWSDGSPIDLYVYGLAKLNILSYSTGRPNWFMNNLGFISQKNVFEGFYESLGTVLKKYAKENYDSFIHLPVEFPVEKSEDSVKFNKIRKMCDELLIYNIENLGIKHYIITGSVEERLKKILQIYNFKPLMSIEAAIRNTEQADRCHL